MRILHVTPYMHPSAGGPPVVVENFVRELNNVGHASEIVSTSLFCQQGDEEHLITRLNTIAPTKFLPRSKLFGYVQSRRLVRERIRTTDIVHVHTLWHPINYAVRLECVQQSKPFVLMPHGMLDPYSLGVKSWRKAAYLWAIERSNISAASRVIYTTREEERLATDAIPANPKSVVIPLGADGPTDKTDVLAARFAERYPNVRGRRRLLFLGRLHEKKGLDRVLNVLPSLIERTPDIVLIIVGDGEDSYEAALDSAIVKRGLTRHVVKTGRLDGLMKWGAYAASEIFLLPSRQENF